MLTWSIAMLATFEKKTRLDSKLPKEKKKRWNLPWNQWLLLEVKLAVSSSCRLDELSLFDVIRVAGANIYEKKNFTTANEPVDGGKKSKSFSSVELIIDCSRSGADDRSTLTSLSSSVCNWHVNISTISLDFLSSQVDMAVMRRRKNNVSSQMSRQFTSMRWATNNRLPSELKRARSILSEERIKEATTAHARRFDLTFRSQSSNPILHV